MPFDGLGKSTALEILGALEDRFQSGAYAWVQYPNTGKPTNGACLLDGVGLTIAGFGLGYGNEHNQVQAFLASAIGCLSKSDYANQKAVEAYNDTPGRTLGDILGVIRMAKGLSFSPMG
jgi:hypothetical protein